MTYQDFIGNEITIKLIKNSIKRNVFPDFTIFVGRPGVGKSTLAKLVAQTIVCENKNEYDEPCYICDKCKMVEMEDASIYKKINFQDITSKNEVKNIKDDIFNTRPIYSKMVYILEEMDKIPEQFQRQLLDELTHIIKGTYIIGCKLNESDMLPAFKSRAFILKLNELTPKEAELYVRMVSGEFGIFMESDEAIRNFAKLCDYNARTIRNKIRFVAENNNLSMDTLRQAFNIVPGEEIVEFVDKVVNCTDLYEYIKYITDLDTDKKLKSIYDDACELMYTYILSKVADKENTNHKLTDILKGLTMKEIYLIYTSFIENQVKEFDKPDRVLLKALKLKHSKREEGEEQTDSKNQVKDYVKEKFEPIKVKQSEIKSSVRQESFMTNLFSQSNTEISILKAEEEENVRSRGKKE